MRGSSGIAVTALAQAAAISLAIAQPIDCQTSEVTGFTEPSARVEVAAREPGIVAKVLVEPGDRVKTGDLLAELDKTLVRTEFESARARAEATGRLAMAKAKLDHSERRMNEIAKLEKSRAVRPIELISAEAELAIAEAEFQAVEDERQIARLAAASVEAKLALLDVRAPFDGVVDQVHREGSELVGAGGDARVVTMMKLDRLYADFFLPVGCIGSVDKGTMLAATLPRLGADVAAQVRNLGVEIDAPTGLRRLSIEIDNGDYRLLAGERLFLRLPIGGLDQ